MSNVSSEPAGSPPAGQRVPWNPWLGVLIAIVIFLSAQFIGGILISVYPELMGWSDKQTLDWYENSLEAKLGSIVLYGLVLLAALHFFLKKYKTGFKIIGLVKPRLKDPLYSLAAFPVYLLLIFITVSMITLIVPGLDLDQKQELGFDGFYGGLELVMIGLALVILVPVLEELIFRGLIYGSLIKKLRLAAAAIITSLLFAVGHLAASSEGPLYIAAIDTFVLSLVLIYLRQKTGSLWPAIWLHALKNGIAFVTVFVLRAA